MLAGSLPDGRSRPACPCRRDRGPAAPSALSALSVVPPGVLARHVSPPPTLPHMRWLNPSMRRRAGLGPRPGSGSGRNMATTRGADLVGRVLGGRYRLLAPIGTGASAHVFLADDITLRRRVAVKLLHPALADDEGFLRRFRSEAQVAAGLNHPNVMAVFDWGEDNGTPFLITEYLGGGSLRSMLDRGTLLSPSQALLIGLQACRGLDF